MDSKYNLLPSPLVAVTYEDVFGELKDVTSIEKLMRELPMVVVLHHVLRRQLSVHFTMYAREQHDLLLEELCNDLDKPERTNLYRFRNRNKDRVILYNTDSTIRMCFEALVHGYNLDDDDKELSATRDEAVDIGKTYTLCNSELVKAQTIRGDMSETLLLVDLKSSEFKFHKDPKAALYKACQFFDFCEKSPIYKVYLKAFCIDYGINDWREYLGRLLTLFHDTINTHAIKIDKNDYASISFLGQFAVDIEKIKSIGQWSNPDALKYFREHFLVHFNGGVLFVISPDFIVDKMYQGLKFMFFSSIVKHGIKNPKGKDFSELPQFTQQLGQDFSETSLAYTLFKKALTGKVDSLITGTELKSGGFPDGEPDLYIRKGRSLILVEVKDLLFPDSVRNSNNVDEIINHIKKRICAYPEKPHKGFGQILDNIERLLNGLFDSHDSCAKDVEVIFPVVMTTDNAFSAIGINSEIVKQAIDIMTKLGDKFGKRFISIPIILDVDTLINLAYKLSQGVIDIFDVFWDYITKSRAGIIPFKVYAYENFQKGLKISTEENAFLFGDIFNS